ncbi:uncharacterized protein C1orf115 homolog [Brienomyrus brachyistius]|uniref:uncharacterized protein C1orf115 homolog n=1 Tax=Brienomyrus brachyistius TaxID=42636 RepID=UPI0020B40774|nr:uncharacterized protein C1orf115 homolog [Brienomyrus brachyistius]
MKPTPLWGAITSVFENIEPRDMLPDGARYLQQVDGENSGAPLDGQSQQLLVGSRVRERDRCAKEIHFAFLPERYEPLVEEDDARERAKEEKKRKKREKYKKYRKVPDDLQPVTWLPGPSGICMNKTLTLERP